MNRREALRLLATGVALPLMPGAGMAMFREARMAVESPTASRTLNAHQEATVKLIAEMILPRTDTPGATDVGVTEFIDLMLTEWYEEDSRNMFLKGLADVDARSQSLFSRDFVDCSAAQQADILTALGQQLPSQGTGVTHRGRQRGDWSRREDNFYSMFRRLTLTAYYTSEAGATAELKFEIIPERHAGCVEIQVNQEEPKQP